MILDCITRRGSESVPGGGTPSQPGWGWGGQVAPDLPPIRPTLREGYGLAEISLPSVCGGRQAGHQGGAGKGAVGVPAPASVPEFLVKVIGSKYKLDLVSAPYRGSAPMMADMLGNQIPAGVASVPDFIENHKAGKLRVVAVLGDKRQAALPDVPTFAELGLAGFEDMPYYGIFAPAGTPPAEIERFGAALQKALALPDVREKLTAMGLTVGFSSSQQLAAREAAYSKVWSRIIKESGFQPQ